MTKKEVMLINEIISNAIVSGGDKEEILKSMNKLLGRINLYVKKPYYIIKSIVIKGSNNELYSVYQFVRE